MSLHLSPHRSLRRRQLLLLTLSLPSLPLLHISLRLFLLSHLLLLLILFYLLTHPLLLLPLMHLFRTFLLLLRHLPLQLPYLTCPLFLTLLRHLPIFLLFLLSLLLHNLPMHPFLTFHPTLLTLLPHRSFLILLNLTLLLYLHSVHAPLPLQGPLTLYAPFHLVNDPAFAAFTSFSVPRQEGASHGVPGLSRTTSRYFHRLALPHPPRLVLVHRRETLKAKC